MIDLLQQGIIAARAGKREEARALLMRVVEDDERNEQAWLWLAGVVDAPEDIRTCLQNVLDLNPANQQAQQGLAWVDKRYGTSAPLPELSVPTPTPLEREIPAAPPPAPPISASKQQRSYTGPTTKLAGEALTSTAVGMVTTPSTSLEPKAAPVAPIVVPPPEYPCPYCGALLCSSSTHARSATAI